jgi:hypothetical protein
MACWLGWEVLILGIALHADKKIPGIFLGKREFLGEKNVSFEENVRFLTKYVKTHVLQRTSDKIFPTPM